MAAFGAETVEIKSPSRDGGGYDSGEYEKVCFGSYAEI